MGKRILWGIAVATAVVVLVLLMREVLAGDTGDRLREAGDAVDALQDDLLGLRGRVEILEGAVSDLDQQIQELRGAVPPPEEQPCVVVGAEVGLEPSPATDHRIPGLIEAEEFDLGGQGVAYNDFEPENLGLAYRESEGVDIKVTHDVSGTWNIGWVRGGEWTKTSVCAEAGVYDVWLRVASNAADPGSVRVSVGPAVLGQVKVPNTGGWDTFTTMIIKNAQVPAGNHVLRLDFIAGASKYLLDINWVRFVPAGTAANRVPTGLVMCGTLPEGGADLLDCHNAAGEPVTCVPSPTGSHCLSVTVEGQS